jgi:hypothetical protein
MKTKSRRTLAQSKPAPGPEHIHLPSVHLRISGQIIDYEEDLFCEADPHGRVRVERYIRLRIDGAIERVTHDEVCAEELQQIASDLPILMDEGNPAAKALMKESALRELDRQARIASGQETACFGCGCSETRACSGGCIWATPTLCSRCAAGGETRARGVAA